MYKEPHGATWGHMVHLVPRLDKWGNILALFGVSRYLAAKGGAFADVVLMGQSHRRICEACLFTKGEWGMETIGGGGRCKQGRVRHWNTARCILINPEAHAILLFPVFGPVHCSFGNAGLCVCVTKCI